MLLMCKNTEVYDINKGAILNNALLPGAMKHGTMDFVSWMQTRYSVGSNVTARRLMLRAFGSDNHNSSLKQTRALSLSDCYWLKEKDEKIKFEEVTPYLNKEWDGTGEFLGGSISTLFVNGASNKKWINESTLVKFNSQKELIPFKLAETLELNSIPKTRLEDADFFIKNFTSTTKMLETMEQSGLITGEKKPQEVAVRLFGEDAVSLFVLDYLVEHDDRHWGNFGFLRCADTGDYCGMAPIFDFDWAWSNAVIPFPENTKKYAAHISNLAKKALSAADNFEEKYATIIKKRAKELILNAGN